MKTDFGFEFTDSGSDFQNAILNRVILDVSQGGVWSPFSARVCNKT